MWTIGLMFLKKNWKQAAMWAIVAAAALAVFLWIHGLYSTIDDQGKQIVQLTSANQILKDNNEKLTTALNANNAAIEKIAKGAADTNNAFNALSGNVKQQSAGLVKRLQDILNEKKPQTCDETILYLIEATKGYAK